jgi:hypothetical protein
VGSKIGWGTSIGVQASGAVHIAYWDCGAAWKLKLASNISGAWKISTLDTSKDDLAIAIKWVSGCGGRRRSRFKIDPRGAGDAKWRCLRARGKPGG